MLGPSPGLHENGLRENGLSKSRDLQPTNDLHITLLTQLFEPHEIPANLPKRKHRDNHQGDHYTALKLAHFQHAAPLLDVLLQLFAQ